MIDLPVMRQVLPWRAGGAAHLRKATPIIDGAEAAAAGAARCEKSAN